MVILDDDDDDVNDEFNSIKIMDNSHDKKRIIQIIEEKNRQLIECNQSIADKLVTIESDMSWSKKESVLYENYIYATSSNYFIVSKAIVINLAKLTIFISEPISRKIINWLNRTMSDTNKYLNIISHFTREENYAFDMISDSITEKSITQDVIGILFEAIESAIDTWTSNSTFATGLKSVVNSLRDIFIGTVDPKSSSNLLNGDLPSTDATASSVSNVDTVTSIVTSLAPKPKKEEAAPAPAPKPVAKPKNETKTQPRLLSAAPNLSGVPVVSRRQKVN